MYTMVHVNHISIQLETCFLPSACVCLLKISHSEKISCFVARESKANFILIKDVFSWVFIEQLCNFILFSSIRKHLQSVLFLTEVFWDTRQSFRWTLTLPFHGTIKQEYKRHWQATKNETHAFDNMRSRCFPNLYCVFHYNICEGTVRINLCVQDLGMKFWVAQMQLLQGS